MIFQLAGYLSGIVISLSFIPYIRDIFRGRTRPQRTSWLIWTILGVLAFVSQSSKGASYSLWMTGAQVIGDLTVFVLALRYGVGGFMKRDILSLVGVAFGLLVWYTTSNAVIALMLVIGIDGIGAVLTAVKAYTYPDTEDRLAWSATLLGGVLACVAVGKIDLVLLAYPFYIFSASALILAAIFLSSRKTVAT